MSRIRPHRSRAISALVVQAGKMLRSEDGVRSFELRRSAVDQLVIPWPGDGVRTRTAATDVQSIRESRRGGADHSSDRLLELVGGPAELTRRIRTLGASDIDIRMSTKEVAIAARHSNQASAAGLARLLGALQRGVVLRPAELAILWDLMRRSQTGKHRLRDSLPAGTPW